MILNGFLTIQNGRGTAIKTRGNTMNCERCGARVPDHAAICPTCGTITSTTPPPSTNYGQYSSGGYNSPQQQQAAYGQGYGPQPGYMPPPQQNFGYTPQPAPVNVIVTNNQPSTNKDSGPLIAEILLSLLVGIYGIGWLIAGETTTGVILLVCSFLVYWPILILGTIFTLGFGLLCLGPLAIGAIIANAILLNNFLNRKASQVVMMQANPIPPQYPPYR
jgi:hypothetical protein